MIFVTVGVQLPFDRLIRAVDTWAGEFGRKDVLAQVGNSLIVPQNIEAKSYLESAEFKVLVARSELIISHAGMGSILTALELGKNIIVMPRRADLGEHRNDHQLATARYMEQQGLVKVANDEKKLIAALIEFKSTDEIPKRIDRNANADLIKSIRGFISGH